MRGKMKITLTPDNLEEICDRICQLLSDRSYSVLLQKLELGFLKRSYSDKKKQKLKAIEVWPGGGIDLFNSYGYCFICVGDEVSFSDNSFVVEHNLSLSYEVGIEKITFVVED